MIIQPNYTAPAISTTVNPFAGRQSPAAETAIFADKVTISQAARELSLSPKGSAQTSGLGKLSEMAHADPVLAKQLASSYTFGIDLPLVDISQMDLQTGDGARYVATGEPVTEKNQAWFANEAGRIREERISLYQSEKAKGTPDADILDKIIRLMDSQPEKYLQLFNWQQVSFRA